MQSNSAYNQKYYASHPELKQKAKLRERRKRAIVAAHKVITREPSPAKSDRSLWSVIPELLATPILASVTTYILLTEMVKFYSEQGGGITLAWITAIAMEGLALYFSFIESPRAYKQVSYRVMAFLILALSTYAMTSRLFSQGVVSYRTDLVTERAISDLETTIKRKQAQYDDLATRGRITAAQKTERSIDSLRIELSQLRVKIMGAKPANAVANTTLLQILWRVVFSIANMFLMHQLRDNLNFLGSFKRRSEISHEQLESSGKILKFQRPKKHSHSSFQAFQDSLVKVFGVGLKSESMG